MRERKKAGRWVGGKLERNWENMGEGKLWSKYVIWKKAYFSVKKRNAHVTSSRGKHTYLYWSYFQIPRVWWPVLGRSPPILSAKSMAPWVANTTSLGDNSESLTVVSKKLHNSRFKHKLLHFHDKFQGQHHHLIIVVGLTPPCFEKTCQPWDWVQPALLFPM